MTKRIHWPEIKPSVDPEGTKAFDAIDAHEQLRNKEQHYGSGIAKHKREAYNAVERNSSPNRSEAFDRDVHYNREHRMARKHALTTRIASEPHHAKKHGHPHGV